MIEQIKTTVSHYLNVPMEHFNTKRGTREKVEARQIAMYFALQHCGGKGKMSLKKIGSEFGGRDHSTVLYAKDVVNDLMDTDKAFKAMVNEIAELLKN